MEHVGADLTATGSVLTRAELEEQRRKRGECLTCGRKCFKKNLFKTIPLTEPGLVLNGRCLECKPLDPSQGNVVIPAFVRRTTQEDLNRFTQSQSRLTGPGIRPAYNQSLLGSGNRNRRSSDISALRSHPMIAPPPPTSPATPQPPTHMARVKSAPVPPRGSPSPAISSHRKEIITGYAAAENKDRASDPASSRVTIAKRGMSLSAIPKRSGSTSYPPEQATAQVAWTDDVLYDRGSNRSMDSAGGRSANSVPHNFTPERDDPDYSDMTNPLAGVASMPSPEAYAETGDELDSAYQQAVPKPMYQEVVEASVTRAAGHPAVSDAQRKSDQSAEKDVDEYDRPLNHGVLNRGGAVSFSKLALGDPRYTESNGTLSCSSGPDEECKVANGGRQSPSISHPSRTKHAHFADEEHLEDVGVAQAARVYSRKTYPAPSSSRGNSMVDVVDESSSSQRKTVGLSRRNMLVEEAEQRALDRLRNAGNDYHCRIKLMKEHPASALIQEEAMNGLSTLDLEESDCEEIASIGGLDACVMGMRSHPHQVEVQIHGCRAMWNLSLTTENQIALLKTGALDCVVTAMLGFADNPEVQENALAIISNLCAPQENHASILESGTVQKIVETMNKHSEDPTVQSQGCAVITNLASFDHAVKRTVMESGAGGAVVISLIMHPEDVKLQEEALHSLRSLCDSCYENIIDMGDVGGVDAAITAMQVHRDEPGVQEAGAWALSTLAVDPENQANIGDCGGIDVLVRAMWVHSDILGVQDWCCSALWKLSEDDQNSSLVIEVGGISALVNAMQAYVDEASVQEKALGVLTNLAADDYESKLRIVDEDAMDAIVMAMVLHSENAGVQQEACKALCALAIAPNLDRMRAANVAELARTAGEKFPMECGDKSSRLLEIV